MRPKGYIPKRIAFIYSDSVERGGDRVIPAYIADADNPKTMESGKSWASSGDYRNRSYGTTPAPKPEVKVKEYDNVPFSGPIINELEKRMEGGRAWKTIVRDDFYCDFREDELLWVIRNKGIKGNGTMNGEFVFAVVGSQMKLIPVGCESYDSVVEGAHRRDLKKIGIKDIQLYHHYETKGGDEWIFLGWVKTVPIKVEVSRIRHHLRYKTKTWIESIGNPEKIGLWYDKSGYSWSSTHNDSPAVALNNGELGEFELRKSIAAVIDHGEIPVADRVTIADVKKKALALTLNDHGPDTLRLGVMMEYPCKYVLDDALVSVDKKLN